ncbi:unnamed protein product [Closterium sp. Naga37s-1]|nr:unnamed protein product [Closterium sp. Naga37s-1]
MAPAQLSSSFTSSHEPPRSIITTSTSSPSRANLCSRQHAIVFSVTYGGRTVSICVACALLDFLVKFLFFIPRFILVLASFGVPLLLLPVGSLIDLTSPPMLVAQAIALVWYTCYLPGLQTIQSKRESFNRKRRMLQAVEARRTRSSGSDAGDLRKVRTEMVVAKSCAAIEAEHSTCGEDERQLSSDSASTSISDSALAEGTADVCTREAGERTRKRGGKEKKGARLGKGGRGSGGKAAFEAEEHSGCDNNEEREEHETIEQSKAAELESDVAAQERTEIPEVAEVPELIDGLLEEKESSEKERSRKRAFRKQRRARRERATSDARQGDSPSDAEVTSVQADVEPKQQNMTVNVRKSEEQQLAQLTQLTQLTKLSPPELSHLIDQLMLQQQQQQQQEGNTESAGTRTTNLFWSPDDKPWLPWLPSPTALSPSLKAPGALLNKWSPTPLSPPTEAPGMPFMLPQGSSSSGSFANSAVESAVSGFDWLERDADVTLPPPAMPVHVAYAAASATGTSPSTRVLPQFPALSNAGFPCSASHPFHFDSSVKLGGRSVERKQQQHCAVASLLPGSPFEGNGEGPKMSSHGNYSLLGSGFADSLVSGNVMYTREAIEEWME